MRPALWTAAALALGIAAASWLRPHPVVALAAVCASLVWLGFRWQQKRAAAAALLAVACFGALRYAYTQTLGRGNLEAWSGRRVAVTGTVVTEPELKTPKGVGYTLAVERVEGAAASGKLYVTQWSGAGPGYGERVEVSGTLKPPGGAKTPGGFDQAAYLARQGVYLTLEANGARGLGTGSLPAPVRWAVAVRHRLEGVLQRALPQRDAALMSGLVFGTRNDIPEDITTAFRESGVLHLLAVSGGNLAMVLVPFLWALKMAGLKRRVTAAAGIPLVLGFVLVTGATPSVLRAGLMAFLVLLGDVLGKERNTLNTLGAAVSILLVCSPGLLFDTGFQLSAMATFGIVLWASPFGEWLGQKLTPAFGEKAARWVGQGLGVTLAAQVMVEPVSLATFGATSLIAPIANLLVLAFVEYLTVGGAVAAVVGLPALPVAVAMGWALRGGLWLLLFTVKATAAVPFAYLEVGRLPWQGVVAWYGVVAVLAVPGWRGAVGQALAKLGGFRLRAPRMVWVAAGLVLAVMAGLVWKQALAAPADTLTVSFLDVGQGDAIAIQAPGGYAAVVDVGVALPPKPGSGKPGFDAGRDVVLPHLRAQGISRLDYLVLTHPDNDHAGGGAAVVGGVAVAELLYSGEDPQEKGFNAALAAARKKGVPLRQPVAGERLALGPEVVLEVLNPPRVPLSGTRSDQNANCVVLRLVYRQVKVLLTCDMEAETEANLLANHTPVQADVLKVAHHGSGYSSTAPFLQAVRPRWAVISVGNGNSYGHPHSGTLDRLEQARAEVFRTDRQGTVTLRTDGTRITWTTDRHGREQAYRPGGLLNLRWLFAW